MTPPEQKTGIDGQYRDLWGARVLITGGAQGIGAAIVAAFTRQGSKVAFLDLAQEAGEAVAEATGATFRCVDLTDVAATREVVSALIDESGPFQVLVNNAAWDERHAIADTTVELWDRVQAVNLRHQFFVTQAVLPTMEPGASIVNLSSTSYLLGVTGMPGYIAAKAGITGMSRSLARELGPRGIRVNAVLPGWVMTERQRAKWVTDAALAATLKAQCLPVEIQPEDVPPLVLFLASDASRMITGQALAVDAGVT